MPRFFAVRGENPSSARLNEEEMHHARDVMRLRPGETVCLIVDGEIYESAFVPDGEMPLLRKLPSPEPGLRVTLYQGVPKGDKMDYIVQKCVEAGVFRIVPVDFSRCVSRWDAKDTEKKRARLARIALEAAKQSGRALCPEVAPPLTAAQLCGALPGHGLALVPWEEAGRDGQCGLRALVSALPAPPSDAAIVIGPEGGLADEEVRKMQRAGARPVTLGPRIFRTETAGLAALIALMALTGNMD